MSKTINRKFIAVALVLSVLLSLFTVAFSINRSVAEETNTTSTTASETVDPSESTTVTPSEDPSSTTKEEPTTQPTTEPTTEPTTQPTIQPTTKANPNLPKEKVYWIKQGSDKNWYLYAAKDSNTRVKDTGIFQNQYGWYYCKDGKVNFKYTGITKNAFGWWRVVKGKVDFKATGLYSNKYGLWRVEKGKVNFKANGFYATKKNGTYYLEGGKAQTNYKGIKKGTINGKSAWYRVVSGKYAPKATGVFKNEYGWWRVENGKVNFNANGLYKNSYGTWKVKNGKVDFGYTGQYKGYNVKKGKVTGKVTTTTTKKNTNAKNYIATVNSKHDYFHKVNGCKYVKQINKKTALYFGSYKEAVAKGFKPCPNCF